MVFVSKIPRHIARLAHEKLNPLLFATLNINEYPKSGGTWVCRMLRDATGYRFDDNTFPRPGNAVVKYHRLPLAVKRMAVVVRDPRDVFVSFFFHCKAVFRDDPFNRSLVGRINEEIFAHHEDEAQQLEAFVQRLVTSPIYPRFTWHAFYEHYLEQGVPIFRYEDFRERPAETLGSLLAALGVAVSSDAADAVIERHSIDRILEARGKSDEPTFIRRGKVGGYTDNLSDQAIARIVAAEGDTMRKFGYL